MDNSVAIKPNEKKQRSSNLELFRIISMLLIVAHHYVVNSGLLELAKLSPTSPKSVFLLLLGAWGKMGINCFVLITGYFMCKSGITLKKFFKLIFEVEFYKIIIYLIFVISGYEAISLTGALKAVLPFMQISKNFTGCFLMFYLCIPFLNILVKHLNEKMHIRLLLLVGIIYVFFGTVPRFSVTMNYFSWYIVLYFIASYVRLYPKKIFDKTAVWGVASLISLAISIVSILMCIFIAPKIGFNVDPYTFVQDSNTFLAVSSGFSLFMFFKNLKMRNSKAINLIASATFGVLLIHANGATMRKWLWIDALKNCEYFESENIVIHAIVSIVLVYVACTLIEIIRLKLIEKPVLKLWDKLEPKLTKGYNKMEDKICEKLHIGDDE